MKANLAKPKTIAYACLLIQSQPLRKVRKDLLKTGSLRPEMMRAMKIIKYLYDHGIAMERLKGTSMPFSSKNDAEAIENMKVTVTIEKLRKAISLYEYHYGKGKDNYKR
jgi:hypothetical protein